MIRVEIEITVTAEEIKVGKRSFFVDPPKTEENGNAESGLAVAMENCIGAMLEEIQQREQTSKIIPATKMPRGSGQ